MIRSFINIIILFFSLFNSAIYGQNINDSIPILLKIISTDTFIRKVEQIVKLEKKISDVSDKKLVYKYIADSCFSMGYKLDCQSDYLNAIEFYKKSLRIFEIIEDKKSISKCYNRIGIVYKNMGDYTHANIYVFKSIKLKEKIKDTLGIADCYVNLGNINTNMGNDSFAIEYYNTSLKLYEKLRDNNRIAACNINLGNVYQKIGYYQKAIEQYFVSRNIYEEANDSLGLSGFYNNMANLYSHQSDYTKALEYCEKAINYLTVSKSSRQLSIIYTNISNLQYKCENYDKAIEYALKGLQIAENIGALKVANDAYQLLKDAYFSSGRYKKAVEYAGLYIATKDSLYNIDKNKLIIEIKTKYETEKKEKEIEYQALKISETELKLRHNKLWVIILVGGTLLIVIFGWITFMQYRNKQRAKLNKELLKQQELRTKVIIETQENERKRIARDLHDETGHKLTTLKIYFEEFSDILDVLPEKKIIFKQIANMLDETHKEIRSLSHRMMPKALQENEFTGAISDLIEITLVNSNIKYGFGNDLQDDVPENIRICLYRVLQELLNNSLKHAKATEIMIQLFRNKDTLLMMFEDNGVGIQLNTNNSSGIGLNNIRARVHSLEGKFLIEKGPVKGTIATVKIPLIS